MKATYYTRILLILSLLSVSTIGRVYSQSSGQNYIQTRTYTNDSGTTYLDAIQYYDGLGRPFQTVQRGITPNGSDLADYQEYDGVGRESSKWLPVVLQNNNGAFASLSTIKSNINASYPGEAKPYSVPVYEASPLNRVLEQYGPGQAWQNNSRSAKTAYLANMADNDTLNCVYYKVADTSNSTDTLVSIIRSGNYETAQLYVTRSTDQDGNASFEFKDKLGQVVLTRQIVRSGSTKIMYDTYYIYDDYGNLAAVLPPLASDNMKSGTSWTNANSALLRNYAYLYRYDSRNRCIQKRLPGTSWTYYVYDKGDRLIFSQDGAQRAQGKWLFSIPDAFGRTVLTGVCSSTGSKTISVGAFEANILKGIFATTGTYNGYNLQLDGSTLTLTGATVGTASYYDNYNFLQLSGFSTLAYDSSAQTSYGGRYTGGYQGMLTGSYTAQAPGSTASVSLCSAFYYDDRNRIIQSASTNHLGGKETECVFYTFTGQPLRKKHIHTATGQTTQTELYTYTYDHAGRLLTTKHKLNTAAEVILAENTYDELGRLKTSKNNNQSNLATTYTYNVRSWMKSSASPLFSQTLYYNDSYGNNTPSYNGNISAMSWTTSGDKTRGYNFAYDNLSRLTAAGYLEGGTANASYGTSYNYDKHGNMTNLVRNGRTGTSTFGTVDNLSMSYAGNQLIKADDTGTTVTLSASMDFKNNSTAAKEYFYDLNGNLTQDLNKGITGITYNFLNLPQSVVISNTLGQATNTYTYAADGRKLRANIGSKQTDYVGNVIYEGGALKRILVDGGYIEGGAYYFYLTDHLGNNRVVANASGGIVQTNHYYPFGMSFAEGVTTSGQPYKYNGKELDTERGLNLYDYSARLMDPALGRFSTVDPSTEKYYSWSPYVYVGNNPIITTDPTGMDWYQDKYNNAFWREGSNSIEGYTNIGSSFSYEIAGGTYLNQYQNTIVSESNSPVDAFQTISNSKSLQNNLLGSESDLSSESQSRLYKGLIGKANEEIGMATGRALLTIEAVVSGAASLNAVGRLGVGLLSRGAAKAGSRAFFSGAGTEVRAVEAGFQTLGQTRAGQNLQDLITSKNIPWSEAEPMWQRLSATWAKGVPNGSSVPVFLNNPRAGAVWFQTELPILQSKGINLIYK
ncbi:DUF6443 domain-containing protein [uncultured Bacteroides sp.]|uniref:DUF6443 domain-containing protein n=1 Tax=uncultured Bacteroides sp. TaxID=162156 RepID=UPI002AA86E0D|nr:DUF6443 domain-containing protein [uncultured Bacteroides sp.]